MQLWWCITESSGHRDELRPQHALPAVGCRTCARERRSRRVLPVECPPAWRARSELTLPRHGAHRALNAEFEALRDALTLDLPAALPRDLLPLQPGDGFAPAVWRAQAIPRTDFRTVQFHLLVSARVRAALEALRATGVTFAETVAHPKSREAAARAVAGYAQVSVTATTGLSPGVDPASVCPECHEAVVRPDDGRREFRITPEMWPGGSDVARLATTLLVAVTDRVREAVEALGATGVRFEPADQPHERRTIGVAAV